MSKDSILRIDKELGIIEKIVPQSVSTETETINYSPVINENDLENDYEYQRRQFYNLVEKGSNAIDGILELAKESEHPRTYEVAGQLIKNVAEVTEKLGDLQKKMKELKDLPNTAPKNVTNALFVGSTTELQKILRNK
ncbi:terminase [Candidatus Pacearchaeota archaeon]|nr:terminase [Candidatus Pacearchaeota archaeon]|tara:strand:- start:71 stop:484 length:414 start_codon:yes stop_codon:yes gene_type:complete